MDEVGLLRGEGIAGGDVTFGGVGIFKGDAARGGEYVRGDPTVTGERRPLGVAREGNGSTDRAVARTCGVPTVCSAPNLKSRGTADGKSGCCISLVH